MISFEEKKTSQQLFYLSEVETLMEKTVEVLSVFKIQRKISLLFQNFEVKIHLKLFFLVSKVIFTRKNVILQNKIKQELQTNGHKAQILLIEW